MSNPFVPKDYFDFAKRVASQSANEADLRAAVSRAYYAVFLAVREKANIRGKEGVHNAAKRAVAAKSSAASGQYQQLREMRVHADYALKLGDDDYDPAYDDWRWNWDQTKYLVDRLLAFLSTW